MRKETSVNVLLAVIKTYTSLSSRLNTFKTHSMDNLLLRFEPLTRYYALNNNIWQDGLLIDFVQKKIVDKWMRKFLIISAYLFSERVLFTFVVKFYNVLVVWPSTTRTIFEFSNVSLMLHATLMALLLFIVSWNLIALYALFF